MDAEKYRNFSSKHDIHGFPTLKFFAEGESEKGIEYSDGRTGEEITTFLNEKCGAYRVFGKGLLPNAGRQDNLDKLAQEFTKSKDDIERTRVLQKAREQAKLSGQKWGFFYSKIMERAMKEPNDFPKHEMNRLERILSETSDKNLHPQKIDELMIRRNILMSFQQVTE